MKRIIITLIFFISMLSLCAQSEDIIRFDLDLQKLSIMSDSELDSLIQNGNILILDGILSSVSHNGNQIILTILNGKWKGTESVQTYQAKINLSAENWSNVFPERPPRNPVDEIINLNSYILVLGKITSSEYNNNLQFVTLDAMDIRVISQ